MLRETSIVSQVPALTFSIASLKGSGLTIGPTPEIAEQRIGPGTAATEVTATIPDIRRTEAEKIVATGLSDFANPAIASCRTNNDRGDFFLGANDMVQVNDGLDP